MKNNRLFPVPAYFRVQTMIREEIEEGRWKPGAVIPTERALAQVQGVSVGTVKKALLNLTHEGYLYRIQGKGTFVAGTPINRESLRYYRLMKRFSGREADLQIRLLKLERSASTESIASCLGLTGDQGLFVLKRLFVSGETPLIYNISYLPEQLFKNLDQQPNALFETTPLYVALEKTYGLPTLYNHELFEATPADHETAGILNVSDGAPVLHIEMTAFTYKNTPYEYREAYCVTQGLKVFRET